MSMLASATAPAPPPPTTRPIVSLSSIGAKSIMALTGLGLTFFVIAHMLGNLQLFLGPDALNAYAAKLKDMPELLWLARLGLLAIFAIHIALGIWLWLNNRQARPVPYVYQNTRAATVASRTMLYSGLVLLAFVVFHLAHYTFGWLYPDYLTFRDPKQRFDVYRMTVEGFRVWWVSLAYIVSMLFLGLHLSHGIASTAQSLGINHPRYNPWIKNGGLALAVILTVGNIAMPVAVLLGVVNLAGGN
jgi:succinate dehydrogenase / fumarate reductase, cytochrome b subunit